MNRDEMVQVKEAMENNSVEMRQWPHGIWGWNETDEVLIMVYTDEEDGIIEEYHNVKSLADARAIVENPNATPTYQWKQAQAWLEGKRPDLFTL